MKDAGTYALPILAGVGVTAATGGAGLPLGMAVAGGLGAAATVYGGQQEMAAAKVQEQQAKVQAEEQKIAGKARAAAIRRQLLATIGAQDAALASRGVMAGMGGTPAYLRDESLRVGADDLRFNRLNTLGGIGAANAEAASARLAGRAALVGTGARLAGMGYDAYSSAALLKRKQ